MVVYVTIVHGAVRVQVRENRYAFGHISVRYMMGMSKGVYSASVRADLCNHLGVSTSCARLSLSLSLSPPPPCVCMFVCVKKADTITD